MECGAVFVRTMAHLNSDAREGRVFPPGGSSIKRSLSGDGLVRNQSSYPIETASMERHLRSIFYQSLNDAYFVIRDWGYVESNDSPLFGQRLSFT